MWKNLKRWQAEHIGKIALSLNTRIVWSLIALFAAGDAIGLKAKGILLAPHDFLSDIFTVTILLF